jgi:murein DD-endopeptidase MepM/ murein hydrolase activator NlpD
MQRRLALLGALLFVALLAAAAAMPTSRAPDAAADTPRPRHTAPVLTSPDADPAVAQGSSARLRAGPLRLPLEERALPTEAELLPEAARDYRAGIHEGIDFPADAGTPVLAAADGRVIRADREFRDWTAAQRAAALAEAVALGRTPERTLDLIRGRQVWIDHGRGIVTRYAHLASVDVSAGQHVRSGEVIGTVGSSGYPEGGPHLHFEVRIGDSYLGDGLTPAQLARAVREAFR